MKQENSQPVKQHKKMNGFADRKLLAGLVFAVGDYMALTLSACLALHLRNIVMTYNVYYINLSYIFFWVPLVFMPFILYSGLYTKRMLTYKMTEKLFYASLYGTCLLYTSDAADEEDSGDLGGRRIFKKKKNYNTHLRAMTLIHVCNGRPVRYTIRCSCHLE